MLLITNLNGCHVLKKILTMICPIDFRSLNSKYLASCTSFLEFLNSLLLPQYPQICKHQHGVIIVKQIVQIYNLTRVSAAEVKKLEEGV